MTFIIVCPLCFLAGLVDAIGGGGGLISLPALLLAGLPPHAALATNKLNSCIGTTVSTARYLKNGFVDWPLALPSAGLAIVGSALGAKLVLLVSGAVIHYVLIGALPVIAFFVLRKKDMEVSPQEQAAVSRRRQALVVLSGALIIGGYDGFYGPGCGTFMLLLFTQLGKMDVRKAAGNVKVANLSSNLGSLLVFLLNREAIIPLGLAAGGFCLVGHYIGSGLVIHNGGKIVRPIVLVVLGLLFIKVITDMF